MEDLQILTKNIHNLRNNIGYTDPIEIWEIGDELTDEMREKLALFPNIVLAVIVLNVDC
jgi:hypothetical protein